jgi:hypothetical protein
MGKNIEGALFGFSEARNRSVEMKFMKVIRTPARHARQRGEMVYQSKGLG